MNRLRQQEAMINGTQGAVLILAWVVGGWALTGLCFAVMWAWPAGVVAFASWAARRRARQEDQA